MARKKNVGNKYSVEDMYCNKHFVPPKEKSLETIFEEPREAKNGVPVLTSVKKYKRFLHFEHQPTENKILKRKKKANKFYSLQSCNSRITRSTPKTSKSDDVLMYILSMVGDCDASNDSEVDMSKKNDKGKTFSNSEKFPALQTTSAGYEPSTYLCDTPKEQRYDQPRTCELQSEDVASEAKEKVEAVSNDESQVPSVNDDVNDETEERRRLSMKAIEILAN